MSKTIIDWIISLIIAIVIFIGISWVVQIGKVSGTSMMPTYHDHEKVLVQREFYNLEKNDVITFWADKDTIDIQDDNFFQNMLNEFNKVIFKQPDFNEKELHIKRIVGVPGDHVVVQTTEDSETGRPKTEVLVNDEVVASSTAEITKDIDLTVAEGEYFVLGDNTDNSKDSRDHGPVKAEDIFGKILNGKENQNPNTP